MKVSREEKKIEAISRMKKIGIFPQTIQQFEKEGYVSISESPFGAFYWAEGEDLEAIKSFEEEYDALVYVVIRSYTQFGKIDSYLYVSDHKEEWEQDRDDLAEGTAVAYCRNLTFPDCSEGGYIGFEKTVAAGLKRTW